MTINICVVLNNKEKKIIRGLFLIIFFHIYSRILQKLETTCEYTRFLYFLKINLSKPSAITNRIRYRSQ